MKLAIMRAVEAKQKFDAADSHFKKSKIATDFFQNEMSVLIKEMRKTL